MAKVSPRSADSPSKKKPPWNAVGHCYPHEDLMQRIRTVVRSARNRDQVKESSITPQGTTTKKESEVQVWTDMFNKYDLDGSGVLDFDEIENLVRGDLKIGERTVSNIELRDFFSHIDLNGDRTIDVGEWLDFVSQGKLKDTRPLSQVLDEVGRAMRLALRRNGLKPNQVEDHLRQIPELATVKDDLPVDLELFKELIRKGMNINRHDAPDEDLRRAWSSLNAGSDFQGREASPDRKKRDKEKEKDKDKNKDMEKDKNVVPLREVFDFLTISCLAKMEKEIGMGTTFPGLIGGMYKLLPDRSPRNRPGTFPFGGTVSGPTTMPFCLNGRNLPPSGRLAVTLTPANRVRRRLRPVISCPELANHKADDMQLSESTMQALEGDIEAEAAAKAEEDGEDIRTPRTVMSPASPTRASIAGHRPTFLNPKLVESLASMSAPTSPTASLSPIKRLSGVAPTQSPLEAALAAAKSVQNDALSDPFESFKATVSSAADSSDKMGGKLTAADKRSALAKEGSYRVIMGKEALNRVEQRLLEAGVDVRGGYHRTERRKVG